MKTLRTITTALLLLAAASIYVQAEDQAILRANVPFAFTVENKTMPAGTYTVSVVRPYDVLKLQSVDKGNSIFLNADPTATANGASDTSLVFQHVGSRYFLTQVWQLGSEVGHDFRTGDLIRELTGQGNTTDTTTILASGDVR